MQVGIETYGSGIWHSWFDRDLSVAGRIIVADSKGNFSSKLVNVERPILRIPTLAIHRKTSVLEENTSLMIQPVDRNVNEKLIFNQETEFVPILGLLEKQLNGKKDSSDREAGSLSSIRENHHLALLSLLANELSISPEEIHDFEL